MSRYTLTGMLVQGDPHKPGPQRKDNAGNLKFRKDGQPDCPFFFAIAIPKNPAQRLQIQGVPDFESQKALLDGDARAAWPQFFTGQRPPNLNFSASLPADCSNPKFANKILDGDGYDEDGKPLSERDGWAGCWIVKVSNGFAPKVQEWGSGGWVETVHTGRIIRPGNIVTISGDCASNQSTTSPGMYMNVDHVAFEDEGRHITVSGGVDANTALGQRGAPANPPASTGVASAPAANPPAAAAGNPPSTTASAPPYSAYREAGAGAGAPPPPGAGAPPPPAGPQMTAAATTTYEEYIKAGWNDQQLRDNGLMV